MHVNRGLLGWGVFFIALGALPLAVRGGAIDAATARRAWELWPLLLIGAGLGLALRQTPFAAAGNVVVGLTLGLMAGGLIVGGIGSAPLTLCGGSASASSNTNGGRAAGVLGSSASVDLTLDCGSLELVTQPGNEWQLTWPADVPAAEVQASTDTRLQVEFGNQRPFTVGNTSAQWDAVLPADPMLSLSVSANAGSVKGSLGTAHVRRLSVSVNAADARLDLGATSGLESASGSANAGSLTLGLPTPQGTLTASLSVNAGTIRVCTPAGVPLIIHSDDQPLGSNNFAARGLQQDGSTWTRGDAATATSRIVLDVSANLGSITLDPEGGCG